jgi:hypothetical protein
LKIATFFLLGISCEGKIMKLRGAALVAPAHGPRDSGLGLPSLGERVTGRHPVYDPLELGGGADNGRVSGSIAADTRVLPDNCAR